MMCRPTDPDFQSLLLTISQDLCDDDVAKMKFLMKKEISTREFEGVNDALGIISLMETRCILSSDNTSRLVEILQELKKKKWIEELKKYEKTLHMARSIPHNVNLSMVVKNFKETQSSAGLAELISENQLVTITGFLGSGKSQTALSYGCKHRQNYPETIVWRCIASDKEAFQTSLKNLAVELGIGKPIPETVDMDSAITTIGQLIQQELQKRQSTGKNLIIIDDVADNCANVVKRFVHSFASSDNYTTKFIITTCIRYLFDGKPQLEIKGFTEQESLEFLSEGETEVDTNIQKDFIELANTLGCLPMGLQLAKAYLTSNHISPAMFMRYLDNTENLNLIEKDIRNMNFHSEERLLFSALKSRIFDIFKTTVTKDVFRMFQMLQFLEVDDIPLMLFDFIPQGNGSDPSLITNSFNQAINMNSFGSLGGQDDNRYLCTHSAIILTLSMHTTEEEKVLLLKDLLWAFALLMNKDVFRNNDLARQKALLPHVRSVLKYAKQVEMPMEDIWNQILLIFVNDLAGYAHNFEGLKSTSVEYSNEAKRLCFQVVGEKEEDVDKIIKTKMEKDDQFSCYDEFSSFIDFTRQKAKYIFEQVKEKAKSQRDSLHGFVPRFTATRYRTPENIELISEYLGKMRFFSRLTTKEYESLAQNKMAVPFNVMEEILLLELVLAVIYTNGRRLFYINPQDDEKLARMFYGHLYLAKELGHCIKLEYSNFPPLDILLSERTGALETCFENRGQFEQERGARLQDAVQRFEEMFQDHTKYFVYGVLKVDTTRDDHHKTNCSKQLLRCFTTMIGIEEDEDKKLRIFEQGCQHAEKLLQTASHEKMQDRRSLPGIRVRVAEFYSCTVAPMEQIKKAEVLFQNECPPYMIKRDDNTTNGQCLGRHEKTAVFGLIDCYIKFKERQKATGLFNNLQLKLQASNDRDKQKLPDLWKRINLLV